MRILNSIKRDHNSRNEEVDRRKEGFELRNLFIAHCSAGWICFGVGHNLIFCLFVSQRLECVRVSWKLTGFHFWIIFVQLAWFATPWQATVSMLHLCKNDSIVLNDLQNCLVLGQAEPSEQKISLWIEPHPRPSQLCHRYSYLLLHAVLLQKYLSGPSLIYDLSIIAFAIR